MYSNHGWSYSPSTLSTISAYRRRRWPRLPRLPSIGPLPFAILLVAGLSWYHFVFGGFSVHGVVLDSVSGQPIAGTRVWSTRASATSAADGSFEVGGVKPPEVIGFDAPGYHGQTLRVTSPFDPLKPRLEPIGVEIDAVDADSGQPVHALLKGPGGASVTADGKLRIAPVRAGQRFSLQADGYLPAETAYDGQDVLRVALLPKLDGRVTDATTGKAVAGRGSHSATRS